MTSSPPSIKIILVGSGGVGKTSLINAFFSQPFENQTNPTVAPAYCSANITLENGKEAELQIWDTAGQERYQAIGSMFYHDSHVAFVCYDAKHVETASTVQGWADKVRAVVPECKIIVVATKADLLLDDEVQDVLEKGEKLAKEVEADSHFLTSAQTNKGVVELFHHAGKIAIDSLQPDSVQKITVQKKGNEGASGGCC